MTRIEELTFGYQKKPLFRDLSLDLPSGVICGLLGKNGAGKTTLLRIICGLLFPDSGRCLVEEMESRRRLPAMLRDLYLIPEEFDVPPIPGSLYRRIYSPLYPGFDHRLFDRCLSEFVIEEDKKLSSMSYGQRKKFLLAFGLASGVRLLLLDEPTNGLDIPSKRQFRRLVAEALSEDRTFLISTHQVRDMQNLIDPIIILDQGRIVFHEELYTVSDRLIVALQSDEPLHEGPEPALYWEKVPGGHTVLRRRRADEEPQSIDLEILFNAVVDGHGVQDVFTREEARR